MLNTQSAIGDVEFKCLLEKQRAAIEFFFQNVSRNDVEKLLHVLCQASNNIFFLGVGKSGFVAQKCAATLKSCGERAFYLSHGDLLHGDLGVVRVDDVVCILSNSGETQELIMQMERLYQRGAIICALTSNRSSTLALRAHHSITLPNVRELDPFNLLPTNSTLVQMMFCDLVAMLLLQARGISLSDYGKNHPSGRIGMRANETVRKYMSTCLPTCDSGAHVRDILGIFSEYGHGCVIIIDRDTGCLLGIFTDGDLRRGLGDLGASVLDQPVASLMTKHPKSVLRSDSISRALEIMETGRSVTVLPVLEEDSMKLCGLLHMHTLVKAGCI